MDSSNSDWTLSVNLDEITLPEFSEIQPLPLWDSSFLQTHFDDLIWNDLSNYDLQLPSCENYDIETIFAGTASASETGDNSAIKSEVILSDTALQLLIPDSPTVIHPVNPWLIYRHAELPQISPHSTDVNGQNSALYSDIYSNASKAYTRSSKPVPRPSPSAPCDSSTQTPIACMDGGSVEFPNQDDASRIPLEPVEARQNIVETNLSLNPANCFRPILQPLELVHDQMPVQDYFSCPDCSHLLPFPRKHQYK
jgi:hypothetical protein